MKERGKKESQAQGPSGVYAMLVSSVVVQRSITRLFDLESGHMPCGVMGCLFPEGGQRAAEFCRSYVMPGGKQRTLFILQRVHLYKAFDPI